MWSSNANDLLRLEINKNKDATFPHGGLDAADSLKLNKQRGAKTTSSLMLEQQPLTASPTRFLLTTDMLYDGVRLLVPPSSVSAKLKKDEGVLEEKLRVYEARNLRETDERTHQHPEPQISSSPSL